MRHFALSAIGRDRPGIVAGVADVLLSHAGNIEDSQMSILRGHFAITLIVSAPDSVDRDALAAALERAGASLGLDAVALNEVSEVDADLEPVPSHIVTVYGTDHPGIVHAVASKLAEHGVTITDLTTRLFDGDGGEPLYAMMLEIAIPANMQPDLLEGELRAVSDAEKVELSFRRLEQDAL
jgi:glycine cleavage system transcriptional repressor